MSTPLDDQSSRRSLIVEVEDHDLPPAFESYARRRSSAINSLIENDVEVPPDEELPDYETSDLPSYEDGRLRTPVTIYRLIQIARNLQHVMPANESFRERPSYRIIFRSGPSMFSKKADMTIQKLKACSNSEDHTGDKIATLNFDRSNKLPWMPRACISHTPQVQEIKTYPMEAPNFNDWKFKIESKVFSWNLASRPASLVLLDRTAEDIAARFVYSKYGTDASKGAEVGQLDIYSGYRSEEDSTVEWMVATCQIAIQHWKNMGRRYKNSVRSMSSSGRRESAITVASISSTLGRGRTFRSISSTAP
jgi:hypothetical protein